MTKGPVLFDLEDTDAAPPVTDAPPVPDPVPSVPQGAAMQAVTQVASRPPSRLARWFWAIAGTLFIAVLSTAAWDYVNGWIARQPVVGWALTGLFAAMCLVLLVLALRELAALRRLARIDGLRRAAADAVVADDLAGARGVVDRLNALYQARPETEWGRARVAELRGDQLDAAALLALADREMITPLDALAEREVEAAARQVATVTALVPLALADVIAALTANLRMIRRIAEVYGGRGGTLGSWRLTRAVMTHLVATGAVAVGDDMLEPILGGSILGKLSRRFGEGLVNGALTARVGVAAMEVCRPLPFAPGARPKARRLVKQALGGLFQSSTPSQLKDTSG
ncbi:YcjF family protein [Tateyamaria sp. SN6-1]|uniref:YcjF family protein n=1 Tax=Tateyamaria sp. SN6-1 TaxID=3092148 RepID=UPI0039F4956F